METAREQSAAKRSGLKSRLGLSIALWVVGCWLACFTLNGQAGPLINTQDPTAFFTNVASRLLHTEFTFGLDGIQIYPTNQYTPSVHRLLQVAANLYDAAATRTYGSKTRPMVSPPSSVRSFGRMIAAACSSRPIAR